MDVDVTSNPTVEPQQETVAIPPEEPAEPVEPVEPVEPLEPVERRSSTARAGLQFPVARVTRHLKRDFRGRVAVRAGVFMAATLEYLAAEMLELSGVQAKQGKRVRITPRDVMLAVHGDAELLELCRGSTFAGAGVSPNPSAWVQSVQERRQQQKKQRRAKATMRMVQEHIHPGKRKRKREPEKNKKNKKSKEQKQEMVSLTPAPLLLSSC